MHAKSASFLWLIGSFRHKNTSLLQRIIGVPKYCVKERACGEPENRPLRPCFGDIASRLRRIIWFYQPFKHIQSRFDRLEQLMWLGKAILVDRNGPAFLEMLGLSGDYDAKFRSKIR